jgi:hypothetical protein
MAKALLHQDPQTHKLLGVWTDKNKAYYKGASPLARLTGRRAMDDWIGGSWDEWVERLVGRNPGEISWESVEVEKSETPKAVFERLTGS